MTYRPHIHRHVVALLIEQGFVSAPPFPPAGTSAGSGFSHRLPAQLITDTATSWQINRITAARSAADARKNDAS